MSRRTLLLALAGALALLSVGLPWGRGGVGADHAMRVTGVAGALLVLAGARRDRRQLVVAGLGIAALALPIGLSGGTSSGRTAYGMALAITALTLLRRPSPTTST